MYAILHLFRSTFRCAFNVDNLRETGSAIYHPDTRRNDFSAVNANSPVFISGHL